MDMYEIEDIILGMAQLVHENRALRKENNDLRLTVAKHDAFVSSLVGGNTSEAKKRYDVLSEIERQNGAANLCAAAGWETNQRYIHNWEEEAERRMGKTMYLGNCEESDCEHWSWCGDSYGDKNTECFCRLNGKSVIRREAEEKRILCPLGKVFDDDEED